MKSVVFLIAITTLITACTTLDVYEKNTSFAQHSWSSKDTIQSSFEITDTNSLYNIYLTLRHEDAYHYKNIWVNVMMQAPDTSFSLKREFILADNERWLGTAMSDVVEHRIAFNASPAKLKKGTYRFKVVQTMREDPLQYVLQAGVRVQKIKA